MWLLAYATMGLLMFVGILLMVVILLQRGRGGGLAGAFGGAGGQSAFGTRAGDVFTKITAVMAIIWVFLAGVSRFALEPAANSVAEGFKSKTQLEQEQNPGGTLAPPPGGTGEEGAVPTPPADNAKPEENQKTSDEANAPKSTGESAPEPSDE